MRSIVSAAILLSLASSPVMASPRLQATEESSLGTPSTREIVSPVSAVTLYRGRAAVTRSTTIDLSQGLHELRWPNLPVTIDPATLQARCAGAGRLLSVEFVQRPVATSNDPVVAGLDERIRAARDRMAALADQRMLIEQQQALIDGIASRIATESAAGVGSAKLELGPLEEQLRFIAKQRTALIEELRLNTTARTTLENEIRALESERAARVEGGAVTREALVTVAAAEGGRATIALTYLVADAGWAPAYSVRASLPTPNVTIEYDALLQQRSGEDWNGVEMTLSTAEPARAAHPPTVRPWYLDVIEASRRESVGIAAPPPPPAAAPISDPSDFAARRSFIDGLSADAAVGGGGPAVSYTLPRPITVATNAQREQRTRIATLEAPVTFEHIAAPLVTDDVYLKGTITNTSAYHLLPGRVAVFLDGDYIGPTELASTAPTAPVELHFGIDRNLTARRQLVSREASSAGLFGGTRRVESRYRVELENHGTAPATVVLWDRIPVSRDNRITITLEGPSLPLATDPTYLAEERPQGLLKWMLNLPPGSSGTKATVVTWGVRVDAPKDASITPLPE